MKRWTADDLRKALHAQIEREMNVVIVRPDLIDLTATCSEVELEYPIVHPDGRTTWSGFSVYELGVMLEMIAEGLNIDES